MQEGLDHCFVDLKLHRLVIEVAVDNHPSRAVADRLGLRLEGISRTGNGCMIASLTP